MSSLKKIVTPFISVETDGTNIMLDKMVCITSITYVTFLNDKATKIDKSTLVISKLFTIMLQYVTGNTYMMLIAVIISRIRRQTFKELIARVANIRGRSGTAGDMIDQSAEIDIGDVETFGEQGAF